MKKLYYKAIFYKSSKELRKCIVVLSATDKKEDNVSFKQMLSKTWFLVL